MDSGVIHGATPILPERKRAALISLLADDDPEVYHTIRETLLGYGGQAVEWLRPYTLDRDPVLRRRAQEVSQHLARHAADEAFLAFCQHNGEDLDLEHGVWLLTQTHYPDINVSAYQALLDNFASELRERLIGRTGSEQILPIVNMYLFRELGFSGNEQNYYDPDNSYLNKVIDRRLGNPISLSVFYLLMARRLRLPVVGVGMPGHFLCRYQSLTGELFVDTFNKGHLLTKGDCIKFLLQAGHGYLDGYLAPVSPRRILLRMCANLHQIYVDLEAPQESDRIQRYIVSLSK